MRIAMTADEFYPAIGGSPVSTMELSTAVAKLGAEPVVITHAYPGQPAEEEIDGVEVKRLNGFVIPRLNRGASAGLIYRLHRCIKYGGFDVVHGQDLYSPMSLMSVHSAKKRGIPSVITCRSVHESTGLWKLIYQPILFTIRRTNRVIAVCRAAKQFCHALGVPPHKTVVILNGVDLSKFNPSVDGSPMRERLGIKDEPLVATAIRLVKRKGPGYLLTAFAKVLKVIPDAKLVIAGWGPEAKNLEAQVKRLGVGKSVFMVGALSKGRVAELMAAADVFVLPSKIEAFGRAAVEAAAVGTPVVCPRAGGMPETIIDGSNGLLFQPGDEGAMANAILRVLGDEQLVKRLRRNGIKTARKLSLETTARRTLNLYEKICEEHV
ncbi:MAG: hypothetical protein AVW06_01650 [Hadesarchaea archaeon DG-33-1]|nr:MAG: hypothetical protein AVW06_01650 [Hadesarchaea archaeon DG-33-1]